MRYKRKIIQKAQKNNPPKEISSAKQASYVVLKPAGYPLRISGEETISASNIITDNPKLFNEYAIQQFNGLFVERGDFVFDGMIFPDFAFRVVKVHPNPSEIGLNTKIELESKKTIKKEILPVQIPLNYKDIIGQEGAKKKCQVIQKFLQNEILLQSPWAPRNIIFHGAPGTGKTMMARALATEAKVNFLAIKASELIGVFVGEGSKKIQNLYNQAKNTAPSIIFLDELDAIALKRNYQSVRGDVVEIVSSLLGELDGFHRNRGVITISATNLISEVDPAVLSRFEEIIEFKLPTMEEREILLRSKANTSPIPFEVNWNRIASKTNNWSGRDLVERLLKTSIHTAILEDRTIIRNEDLEIIISNTKNEQSIGHYT